MKTFGRIFSDGDFWRLRVEPHVAIRVKRLFGKVQQHGSGEIKLAQTDENARDLEWLLARYPLEFEIARQEGELIAQARTFDSRAQRAIDILTGDYPPLDVEMAIEPREYQLQAATLCKSTGSLLCADHVGLGKTVTALTLLADAESFPVDYQFAGTKTERVKQIGNAVPVRTASALCEAALRRTA